MDDLVETILQKFEFMKDKAIRLITSGLNKKKVNVSVIKAWITSAKQWFPMPSFDGFGQWH